MRNDVFVHSTAIIEKRVKIGKGTKIWDNAHVRKNASVGKNCIIGDKSYIAYNVKIGNLVKINSFVYICAGVTIKDRVMISAGAIFTNDRFPRAVRGNSNRLFTSDPTQETEETIVEEGVTIGAGAVIGCGITLEEYCMVGMGSVVTKDVPAFALVYGVPAQVKGYVCRCGHPLVIRGKSATCGCCQERYLIYRQKGKKVSIKPHRISGIK